jgi:subtilisin family serine protease
MKSAALAVAFFAAASQALAPLNRGQKVVPSQYVVLLKEGVDASAHMSALSSFMAEDNVANEILHKYSFDAFQGYAVRCSQEVVQFIREAEDVVELVEEDQFMSAYAVQNNPPSWGLDRVDQRSLPLNQAYNYPTSAGAGVDMYTIDTGIRITHNDFASRAKWGFTANPSATDDDKNGHGTHCSGTMAGTSYGIAKKANLIAVKVLGDLGSGTTADVISGVNYVANQHGSGDKSVANMSLGGGASTSLDNAVDAAVNKGVHVAVAAGNDNANACNYSPARSTKAVTVGATDSADRKASYSNFGNCVDIHAPGTSITSAWIGSNSDSRSISGTSMASPHVAGVMALYLGEGKVPSEANLVSASTKNEITGLPSGTVNYLLYTSATLAEKVEEPKIYF